MKINSNIHNSVWRAVGTFALAVAINSWPLPLHGQQIYVGCAAGNNNGLIGEYTLGATPGTIASSQPSLITGLPDPQGIAISGSYLFVANEYSGTVGEYTTSGAMVNASLIAGLNSPFGIAISGNDLFVANYFGAAIGEYTLGATPGTIASSQPSLITGLIDPSALAISGNDLFVTELNGTVGEYTTSGATVNASLITAGLYNPYGIAISGNNLFVGSSSGGTIGKFTLGATPGTIASSQPSFILNDEPWGLAISGNDLFAVMPTDTKVIEYTTSGATVNTSLITGLPGPFSIAVAPVPEPGTLALLGLACSAFRRTRWMRYKSV